MPDCCVYYRGELPSVELSQILAHAERRGLRVSETLRDEPPAVASFRRLQDYIKLGLCRRVLMPSYEHLGDDEWLRLENELFLRRNGVKAIYLKPHGIDGCERFANAVKRYFSPANTWELRYGDMLPPPPARTGERSLPYGYTSENGAAAVYEPEAKTVRLVFELYAQGLPLADIAAQASKEDGSADLHRIRSILYCGRYVGETDAGGRALSGIISRALWFAALNRRAAALRVKEKYRAQPYFKVRGVKAANELDEASSARLEAAAEDSVSMLVKGGARQAFEHAAAQRLEKAQAALEASRDAQDKADAKLDSLIKRIECGCAEPCRDELTEVRDACFTVSMRLRRVETEAELYSLTPEQIKLYFDKAANVKRLCPEEKAFIVSSLLISATASESGFTLVFASPDGGLVKRTVVV